MSLPRLPRTRLLSIPAVVLTLLAVGALAPGVATAGDHHAARTHEHAATSRALATSAGIDSRAS